MELKMIKLIDIVANPLQPRQEFNREKIQELANSIKEAELLQPIVVRNFKGKYEIVAGERTKLGLKNAKNVGKRGKDKGRRKKGGYYLRYQTKGSPKFYDLE